MTRNSESDDAAGQLVVLIACFRAEEGTFQVSEGKAVVHDALKIE
jgi:hypothetical protein